MGNIGNHNSGKHAVDFFFLSPLELLCNIEVSKDDLGNRFLLNFCPEEKKF